MVSRTTKKKPKSQKGEANGIAPIPGEVLTLAEAAAFLRVSEEGLKADAAAGRVPGRCIAGKWRFVKQSLLTWLGQPESQPRPYTSGPELVEHIRRIRAGSQFRETPAEAEAFLARIRAARKADVIATEE